MNKFILRFISSCLLFIFSILLSPPVLSSPPRRTVFVQLFEWPWKDIARECEFYLGPQGFAAVQVSPPQEHLKNNDETWWSRYQAVSYQLISRSGSEAEFIDMVQRCQRAGVDVYADTILNHMTGVVSGVGSAGTRFTQYEYPKLYNNDDFHFCGRNGTNDIKNWTDLFELQFCQLVGLADLKTESPKVQKKLVDYINHLIDIGVKGLRIDAAKHIPPQDIFSIVSRAKGNPYVYLELIVGPDEPIPVQKYLDYADINVFPYSFLLGNAFHQKKIASLNWINENLPPSDKSIVFLENHDLERMQNYRSQLLLSLMDEKLHFLGTVFMLTWPYGYPQLYSGYEFQNYDQGPPSIHPLDAFNHCQSTWRCQHRSQGVASLVQFRNHTDVFFFATNWWSNGKDQIAYSRGHLGFVAINLSPQKMIQTLQTDLDNGTYCNILAQQFCTEKFSVKDHRVTVVLQPLAALVLQSNIKPSTPEKVGP